MDVDGVLTDGRFFWGPGDVEFKQFSFRDIMGISLAQKGGLVFALISGEGTALVDRYAAKMSIQHVHKGCKDKAGALRAFAENTGMPMDNICFIGDDVNDLPALALAGFSAAPADAHPKVLEAVDFVAKACGGQGAVREILDYLTGRGVSTA